MTSRPQDSLRPYTLIAELTYRCPLRCSYCSNPVHLAQLGPELDTDQWASAFAQAEALGVMQVNLTGGEPLVRDDLESLVKAARGRDLYTNLITSGIPLERDRLERLRDAGLDSVQLSIQDVDPEAALRIAGQDAMAAKTRVAAWVRELQLPLTINVVLHRENVSRVSAFIALVERWQADRLELAHVQYLGWGLLNRDQLLPTADMIADARATIATAQVRLRSRMEILAVLPDYYADRPRACMDGWARRYMVIAPDGRVLPCHAAHTLPGLSFESVTDRALGDIWHHSDAFNRFRGDAWMPAPCRTCEQRTVDFGGCRCQAFQLTGDATATDPTCSLAPDHDLIVKARGDAQMIAIRTPRLRRPPTIG